MQVEIYCGGGRPYCHKYGIVGWLAKCLADRLAVWLAGALCWSRCYLFSTIRVECSFWLRFYGLFFLTNVANKGACLLLCCIVNNNVELETN